MRWWVTLLVNIVHEEPYLWAAGTASVVFFWEPPQPSLNAPSCDNRRTVPITIFDFDTIPRDRRAELDAAVVSIGLS
jgi:hypothetical protein